MEEKLVAAFASRLKDPAAALFELRDPGSDAYKAVSYFYRQHGAASANLGAHALDTLVGQMGQFFNNHLKDGEREVEDGEIYAHFTEQHALKTETQSKIAGYDNIENLLAQECDFTALSMGVATLRQQENPKTPASFEGCAYIKAQFHGPVLLERDVEEIRIDTFEMREHFEHMFSKLPKEERDALDEDAWVQARFDEAVAEIKADTRNAPFKVTFYDSEKTLNDEANRVYNASKSQNAEAVSLLKADLVALGEAFKGERFAEVADGVARRLAASRKEYITALAGERLEKIPDWLTEAIRRIMDENIATFGTDSGIYNESKVLNTFVRSISDLFTQLDTALTAMDPDARNNPKAVQDLRDLGFAGRDLTVADPHSRIAILKEIARSPQMSPTQTLAYIEIHLAGEKALADVNAFVRETFEKDIDGGADLMKWAFDGLPPVSGAAERAVAQRIQNEIRAIKADIVANKLRPNDTKPGKLVERLRKRAVQPFIEPKARILAAQVHMEFPSQAERNAFIAWAASAGKIKTEAEFVGVYEGSTLLADSLTAKLAAGTWTLGGPAAPASDATLTVAAGALAFAADDAATGVALSFADGAALGVVMPGGQSPGSTGVILTNGLAAAGATLPVRVIAPDADKGDSFRLAAFTAPAATVDALLPKLAGTASHAASAAVTFSASAAYDLGGVSVKTVTASISPAAFVIVVR